MQTSTSGSERQMGQQSVKPGWVLGLLLLLTLLAGGLRVRGLGARLPHVPDPDWVIVGQAQEFEGRRLDPNWQARPVNPQYPLLLGHLLDRLPGRLSVTLEGSAPLDRHLAAAGRPFLTARWLVAALSLLLIPGTYRLARQFLATGPALLAGALVATSLLSLLYSQQARPHIPLTVACLYALLADLSLVRLSGPVRGFLASLATAVAVGTLHNGLASLLPLAAAAGLRWRYGERQERRWLWALPVLPLLALYWCYPALVADVRDRDSAELEGIFWLSGHAVVLEAFDGSGFVSLTRFFWNHDPLILVLCAAGLLSLLPRTKSLLWPLSGARTSWVLLSLVLPYTLAIGMYARSYGRFLLPLLPMAACLAAYGATWSAGRLARRSGFSPSLRRGLSALAAALLLGLPTWLCWRLTELRTTPDTESLAAAWLQEQPEALNSSILVSGRVSLPLVESRTLLRQLPNWSLSPWQRYLSNATLGPEHAVYRLVHHARLPSASSQATAMRQQATARQVAAGVYALAVAWVSPRATGTPDGVRSALLAIGPPTRVFSSGHPSQEWEDGSGFSLDHDGWMRLLRSERLGPRIEVWRRP